MNDQQLLQILENATTIAVVGASTNPEKPSHQVPLALIKAGYTLIPVHPKASEIFGQTAYPTLADIPEPVDIVDVFRPAGEVPGIAEQAIAIGAKFLWVQEGIISQEAARLAEDAGLTYLEDICIGETTKRLNAGPGGQRS